jgi:hypothetical protein
MLAGGPSGRSGCLSNCLSRQLLDGPRLVEMAHQVCMVLPYERCSSIMAGRSAMSDTLSVRSSAQLDRAVQVGLTHHSLGPRDLVPSINMPLSRNLASGMTYSTPGCVSPRPAKVSSGPSSLCARTDQPGARLIRVVHDTLVQIRSEMSAEVVRPNSSRRVIGIDVKGA